MVYVETFARRVVSQTNLHITAACAGRLLKTVRFTRGMVETLNRQGVAHELPSVAQLGADEQMLLAALERIRDLEARRAAR